MWAYENVFYQIYPLGFCGAPFENDGVLDKTIDGLKNKYGGNIVKKASLMNVKERKRLHDK